RTHWTPASRRAAPGTVRRTHSRTSRRPARTTGRSHSRGVFLGGLVGLVDGVNDAPHQFFHFLGGCFGRKIPCDANLDRSLFRRSTLATPPHARLSLAALARRAHSSSTARGTHTRLALPPST